MDNAGQGQLAVGGGRREPSIDPVKAQGILTSVNKKAKHAARLWSKRWGFYTQMREIQEEEAKKIGMSVEEYRAALRSVSCKPVEQQRVHVEPSPTPLPLTSSGIIGHRALYPLDCYGPLVKTGRNYPTRPPLPPGQIYDPYKQTMIFLGGGIGDPISYKLPVARSEVTDDMWTRPQQLTVTQFDLL
ncbi:uncharacterized protein LOC106719153 isoform X1 [Papilio machaon]|uniref:uncharacterized protein LOC106719153 isoform X1 n=2 Tax=Papilio machaon TaxID=76193 RepID=UPI001E663F7F|nr:uncharacterized protein LOC106719153 isoform X1 [Papilio machaon]